MIDAKSKLSYASQMRSRGCMQFIEPVGELMQMENRSTCKIGLMILSVSLLFSCGTWYMNPKPVNHERISEIATYIHRAYDLVPSRAYIKTPKETIFDGEGDCGDLSALLAYWMVEERLLPFEYVVWDGGYDAYHANIRYDGRIYDPVFTEYWSDEGWSEIATYSWGNLQATWRTSEADVLEATEQ
jgi:hypothetical protein